MHCRALAKKWRLAVFAFLWPNAVANCIDNVPVVVLTRIGLCMESGM